jgi:hypothetical protein
VLSTRFKVDRVRMAPPPYYLLAIRRDQWPGGRTKGVHVPSPDHRAIPNMQTVGVTHEQVR